jgi:hypothetical protein
MVPTINLALSGFCCAPTDRLQSLAHSVLKRNGNSEQAYMRKARATVRKRARSRARQSVQDEVDEDHDEGGEDADAYREDEEEEEEEEEDDPSTGKPVALSPLRTRSGLPSWKPERILEVREPLNVSYSHSSCTHKNGQIVVNQNGMCDLLMHSLLKSWSSTVTELCCRVLQVHSISSLGRGTGWERPHGSQRPSPSATHGCGRLSRLAPSPWTFTPR